MQLPHVHSEIVLMKAELYSLVLSRCHAMGLLSCSVQLHESKPMSCQRDNTNEYETACTYSSQHQEWPWHATASCMAG